MKHVALIAVGLLIGVGSTPASADNYWEVEAARANARAGGPTNARDAELLERYGCLSGTRNAFCERIRERNMYPQRPRRSSTRY